jgi:hypothetical protein
LLILIQFLLFLAMFNSILRNRLALLQCCKRSFSYSAAAAKNLELKPEDKEKMVQALENSVGHLIDISMGTPQLVRKLMEEKDSLWKEKEGLLKEMKDEQKAMKDEQKALLKEIAAEKDALWSEQKALLKETAAEKEALLKENHDLANEAKERTRLLLVARRKCGVRGALEFLRAQVMIFAFEVFCFFTLSVLTAGTSSLL